MVSIWLFCLQFLPGFQFIKTFDAPLVYCLPKTDQNFIYVLNNIFHCNQLLHFLIIMYIPFSINNRWIFSSYLFCFFWIKNDLLLTALLHFYHHIKSFHHQIRNFLDVLLGIVKEVICRILKASRCSAFILRIFDKLVIRAVGVFVSLGNEVAEFNWGFARPSSCLNVAFNYGFTILN